MRAISARLSRRAAVRGRCRGHNVAGQILSLAKLSNDLFRVAIRCDQPVDVVAFDRSSAFRSRVTAVITDTGVSPPTACRI